MKYLFEKLLGWMNESQLNALCIGTLIASLTPNPYSIICFVICFVVCVYRIK